jgi:hypothetical protein
VRLVPPRVFAIEFTASAFSVSAKPTIGPDRTLRLDAPEPRIATSDRRETRGQIAATAARSVLQLPRAGRLLVKAVGPLPARVEFSATGRGRSKTLAQR